MLQQHIDKEIVDLITFIKANSYNILAKEWDKIFMDWSYLLAHIDDFHVIISLLYEKWANIYKNIEWENDRYKEVYETLLNIDSVQAQEAYHNYEQMRAEAKGIEKMLFMLRTILQWLSHLNILEKNNAEICNIGQVYIIFYGYKKTSLQAYYHEEALKNDTLYYLKIVESLLNFFYDKNNLYYIHAYK